ncbi:hypothetical protein [Rickettsia endosymbiont of Urophora cardui]|uniref:hypothetical protein n=1 Tax=Rickettsia endosymbiont of Urophora cardui TaxID=3066265 RepID=UPI00313ED139
MQTKRSYNNSVFIDENTDPKIDGIIPYNYKKRREELNQIVKRQVAKQQQKLTQKNKSIVR